jgi:hypothetical protein
MRMPSIIEDMATFQIRLPERPNQGFSSAFLKKLLGGRHVSNGWYCIPRKPLARTLFPQLQSYWVLSYKNDPLLPRRPGQHGCQISYFLAELEEENVQFPLFIRIGDGGNIDTSGRTAKLAIQTDLEEKI